MSEQAQLETKGIGTKETTKLEPATVKIVKAYVEEVGEKKSKKVQCEVKHPAQEDTIKISSVRSERKGKLGIGGLWFNEDEDGLIRKGSLLADFLNFVKVPNIKELEGKEVATVEDDSGYLVFKAY